MKTTKVKPDSVPEMIPDTSKNGKQYKCEDSVPEDEIFGKKWEKEMMKFNKQELITLIREAFKNEMDKESKSISLPTDEEVMIYFNNHVNGYMQNRYSAFTFKIPAMSRSDVLDLTKWMRSQVKATTISLPSDEEIEKAAEDYAVGNFVGAYAQIDIEEIFTEGAEFVKSQAKAIDLKGEDNCNQCRKQMKPSNPVQYFCCNPQCDNYLKTNKLSSK